MMPQEIVLVQGQPARVVILLYDLDIFCNKPSDKLEIKLRINEKLGKNLGKTWTLKQPFPNIKRFIHDFPIPKFSQREVPLPYLYTITVLKNNETVLTSKEERIKLFQEDRYLEFRVEQTLRSLNFNCTYFGGSGKPDILATHVDSKNENIDVEVTNSPVKYSYNKFCVDLENFKKNAKLSKYNFKRLLIVHTGSYIQKAVADYLTTHTDPITIVDFKTLSKIKEAYKKGILTKDKAHLLLIKSGIVKYEYDAEHDYIPIQNLPIKIVHYFAKERKNKHFRELAPLVYIRDIKFQEIFLILDLSKRFGDEYRTCEKFKSIMYDNRDEITKFRQLRPQSTTQDYYVLRNWLLTLRGLNLLDERCHLTSDGENLLNLWKFKEKNAAIQRLCFHFITSKGVKNVVTLLLDSTKKYNPYGMNKYKFMKKIAKKMVENNFAKTESGAIKDLENIIRWLSDFGLARWNSLRKCFDIDLKRINAIEEAAGNL